MHLRYTTTTEFDAPLEHVRVLLVDQRLWPTLLPGLEHGGSYWRYRGELYELHIHTSGAEICIQAACPAFPQRSLDVVIVLEDTRITTRATWHIHAELPLRAWWAVRANFRALADKASGIVAQQHAATIDPTIVARYPRTFATFEAMGATEHLERIMRLDAVWDAIRQGGTHAVADVYTVASPAASRQPPAASSFDLIYAGGGLGLLHAALMAQRYGYRVLLFDRGEVGCVHREWNISREELDALVASGLFTHDELRAVVMNEYARGLVRFHSSAGTPTDLWLPTILNVALDAGLLLQLARNKLVAAGGTVLDYRSFQRVSIAERGPAPVWVEVACADDTIERHDGRLLLDGMGSTSPLALQRFAGQPFAGVCPTVGTIVSGLVEGDAPNQHNRQLGDILLSVDDAQRGQQYMWEGFPGRGDQLTVYLFYYDTFRKNQKPRTKNRVQASEDVRFSVLGSPALLQLFEDYFALLPTYKQPGPAFRHHKPVYGYIPARHSLRRQEAPLLRGVLPVGDSAAQQSPLTFCGFGSHVRNLDRTTSLLDAALRAGLTEPQHLHAISAYQANVSLNWVFSRFMQPWGGADDVNTLQNIFLQVLNDLGTDLAQRFFRDQMRWSDYHKLVLGMFFRHPPIVQKAWRVLGPAGVRQWIGDYVRYSSAAASAAGAQLLGGGGQRALVAVLARARPAAGLRVQAALAEWRASGWL